MGDLRVTGYGEDYSDNGIYCSKLDTFGRSGTAMVWIDYKDGDDVWYGWYDSEGDIDYNDSVELASGEAVWLTSPSAEYQLNWPNPLGNK